MAMKSMTYEQARPQMKPGDVIAFGGSAAVSEIIKTVTRANVSHVGVILQTKVVDDDQDRFFNQVIESTGDGVGVYRASKRVALYEGDVWWLPRNPALPFDASKFYEFLFGQDGKSYDTPQAVLSAIDALDDVFAGPTKNREDFSRFFCSELVAAGLEAAGLVGSINASEVTPIDLCRWRVFEDDYCLLKRAGETEKHISRYNQLDPLGWAA